MAKTEGQGESNNQNNDIVSLDGNLRGSRINSSVTSSGFAGRIGGNQEYIIDSQDDDARELLKKQPDAVRITNPTRTCKAAK